MTQLFELHILIDVFCKKKIQVTVASKRYLRIKQMVLRRTQLVYHY